MVKQSPSRNQRSKGFKVKRVLQICVLLAICFWLVYQVKHSHDKKKAFDESNANISLETHASDEILSFGRKGLHPRFDETIMKNEKLVEGEAEEEETGGGGDEEEENKQEDEDQEEDKEDEGRGGVDDETEEHDQEKSEVEVEGEEDLIDEGKTREEADEKETEEKDVEDKGSQNENENLEDHDRDGGSRNAHEAREEQYMADDASSAVTHEAETENDRGTLENTNENTEMNTLEEENKVNNTEEITAGQNNTGLKAGEGEIGDTGIPTGKEEKGNEIVSSKSDDSSVSNATVTTDSNNQPEVGNNSAEGNSETRNSSLQSGTEAQNATTGDTTSEAQTIALGQENNSSAASHNSHSDSHLVIPGDNEHGEVTTGDSNSSSTSEENTDATQNEKDESADSYSKTENADGVLQDPIESLILPFTDLDTLPEIRTEGSDNEDAASE